MQAQLAKSSTGAAAVVRAPLVVASCWRAKRSRRKRKSAHLQLSVQCLDWAYFRQMPSTQTRTAEALADAKFKLEIKAQQNSIDFGVQFAIQSHGESLFARLISGKQKVCFFETRQFFTLFSVANSSRKQTQKGGALFKATFAAYLSKRQKSSSAQVRNEALKNATFALSKHCSLVCFACMKASERRKDLQKLLTSQLVGKRKLCKHCCNRLIDRLTDWF